MENYSTLETILIGLIALLTIFWFSPGIKASLERSKTVPADWGAVLIPLVLVAFFVTFLLVVS